MLINSFSYLDELTFSALKNCIDAFDQIPENLPELAFDYYANLTCTKNYSKEEIKKKAQRNPIDVKARKFIIKGFQSFKIHYSKILFFLF